MRMAAFPAAWLTSAAPQHSFSPGSENTQDDAMTLSAHDAPTDMDAVLREAQRLRAETLRDMGVALSRVLRLFLARLTGRQSRRHA
jgi:hypothetical protein